MGEWRTGGALTKRPATVVAAARLPVGGAGGRFRAFTGRMSRRSVQGGRADLGQAEPDRIRRTESSDQTFHGEWADHRQNVQWQMICGDCDGESNIRHWTSISTSSFLLEVAAYRFAWRHNRLISQDLQQWF